MQGMKGLGEWEGTSLECCMGQGDYLHGALFPKVVENKES